MSVFSKKDKGDLILVIDVQSSVVRGSLVLIRRSQLPYVVYTYNATIPFNSYTDSNFLIKSTLQAVEETVQATLRHLHIRIAEGDADQIPHSVSAVHYTLCSPWIVSQAKVLSLTSEKNMHITRRFILDLIDQERAKLIPSPTDPLRVIEEKIFDVRLNGYSVVAWEGKMTTDVQVSFTVSIAGENMIQEFIRSCRLAVNHRRVFFHSSLLLQYIGMGLVYPKYEDYALIHIHGELTDFTVVRQNHCTFFGSFPSGVRTLVRKLATAAKLDDQAADSLLTLYIGGHLDAEHGKKSLEIVDQIASDWIVELQKLFIESAVDVQPLKFILSAWAHDEFYLSALRRTYPKISVDTLSIDDILTKVEFAPQAERRRLTGLYAAALKHML